MKYIKTFEAYNPPGINDPKIGDYVIIKDTDITPEYANFLANNIAKIIDDVSSDMASKKSNGEPFRTYEIKYPVYKLPKWFKDEINNDGTMTIWDGEIVKFSKNKKDLQAFIAANKYNI